MFKLFKKAPRTNRVPIYIRFTWVAVSLYGFKDGRPEVTGGRTDYTIPPGKLVEGGYFDIVNQIEIKMESFRYRDFKVYNGIASGVPGWHLKVGGDETYCIAINETLHPSGIPVTPEELLTRVRYDILNEKPYTL